jgi:hypothetical protein
MTELLYPQHWNFALSAAFGRLEDLIWNFDAFAAKHDHGFPFLGVPDPYELITVIDGFLTESLYQGDVTRLQEMRLDIENRLIPAYGSGQESAAAHWSSTQFSQHHILASMTVMDFRAEAQNKTLTMFSPSQKCWFVEGFCKMWQVKVLNYTKQST